MTNTDFFQHNLLYYIYFSFEIVYYYVYNSFHSINRRRNPTPTSGHTVSNSPISEPPFSRQISNEISEPSFSRQIADEISRPSFSRPIAAADATSKPSATGVSSSVTASRLPESSADGKEKISFTSRQR